jgi:hypothetical protein
MSLDTVHLSLLVLVGPVCGTSYDGQRVNALVESLLNQGFSVALDFHGVKLVTPTFYAASVGNLELTRPKEFAAGMITVSEMPTE